MITKYLSPVYWQTLWKRLATSRWGKIVDGPRIVLGTIGLAALAAVIAAVYPSDAGRAGPEAPLFRLGTIRDTKAWHEPALPEQIGEMPAGDERLRWQARQLKDSLGPRSSDWPVEDTAPSGLNDWPAIKNDDASDVLTLDDPLDLN